MESKYGTDSLNKRMKGDRDVVLDFVRTSKRPVVDTTADPMRLLNANSYQKGSWVLHMLRRQLGDAVFHKSIRDYYTVYGGKNADTKDLQKIFENNSGKKLDQFFQQWLYTPENLQLDISWKYNKKEKNVAVTVKQLQSSGSFQFPFELLIRESLDSMPKRMIKTVNKRTETFLFPVRSKPVSVEADPATSLLYEGNTSEIK
jgi:aminopeptidase N